MDYLYLSLALACVGISFISSPMVLGLLLVTASFLAALFIGASASKWFMFILLLVFTGGMMIMVLYIANLAAGLKIRPSDCTGIALVLAPALMPWLNSGGNTQAGNLMKINNWEILAYLMGFLLLGLFLIVFVVNKHMGALR